MTDALIYMRVPAATKASWVRESRAAGMRLTNWIEMPPCKPQPNAPPAANPQDAQVHLRVPMAVKAQWVRESRACGMKLTDWLLQRIAKGSA